ncbi:MAG TPA: 16S rRNA (cytosine(1402)-N(4))-methyltransferase RsmH [Bryobacteraceae bacterium]|nr:16S rRNA (cytosine(1402)-N(4))-methyltransferase RsmH [Bryobacteraceae bacterium]
MHVPVMPAESLALLAVRPDGIYLDATSGLGGHTALIAQQLETGTVIANDRDLLSIEKARQNTEAWKDRIRFHHGSFCTLAEVIAGGAQGQFDGILADLGVSRYQLTDPQRGFSFMSDGPLDMRMDQSTGMTAADLVNYTDEKTLADLIYQFGEERRARKVARAIVRARPIRSTLHLADVVLRVVPRTGHLHPATKTFQALRMQINQESGQLDCLLQIAPDLLKKGGRMVVISFQSYDDKKVKERFKVLGRDGIATILTKHPLQPSEEETRRNPAARSAKLRALALN